MRRTDIAVVLGAAVFGICSAGAAIAQEAATPIERAATVGDILGVGWIKTFPYEETETPVTPAGATIIVPEVYETVLESAVRADLSEILAANGFRVVSREDDAGESPLILSINAKVTNEFMAEPPQSPLRFSPPLNDPVRDDRFRTITPPSLLIGRRDVEDADFLYWDTYIKNRKDRRSVMLNVYLHQDGKRVWGGFAAAEIGPKGRTVLARAMAAEIAASIGGATAREPAAFVAAPAAIAQPAIEIRQARP